MKKSLPQLTDLVAAIIYSIINFWKLKCSEIYGDVKIMAMCRIQIDTIFGLTHWHWKFTRFLEDDFSIEKPTVFQGQLPSLFSVIDIWL